MRMFYPSDLSDEQVRQHLERIKSNIEAGQWDRWLRIANEIDAGISGVAVLDRLTAKLQTYRARRTSSSQASLLDALADDIAEEREKVRGAVVSERVILATNEPKPITEIDLSIEQMREMLSNAEAGGSNIIKVYADRAVEVMR